MTTSVKIHVNGKYRAAVKQTFNDGRTVETEIEGNYNGATGEHTFYLGHPAVCTFEISETAATEDEKKPAAE